MRNTTKYVLTAAVLTNPLVWLVVALASAVACVVVGVLLLYAMACWLRNEWTVPALRRVEPTIRRVNELAQTADTVAQMEDALGRQTEHIPMAGSDAAVEMKLQEMSAHEPPNVVRVRSAAARTTKTNAVRPAPKSAGVKKQKPRTSKARKA